MSGTRRLLLFASPKGSGGGGGGGCVGEEFLWTVSLFILLGFSVNRDHCKSSVGKFCQERLWSPRPRDERKEKRRRGA